MPPIIGLELTPPVSASVLPPPRRAVLPGQDAHPGAVHPRVGALVRVARGPAAGARGRLCRCANGRATLLATLLTRRPFPLTVDADDCVMLTEAT